MAHSSEKIITLATDHISVLALDALRQNLLQEENVYLFWLPAKRKWVENNPSEEAFNKLNQYCAALPKQAVVCVLTTPEDAAGLVPALENSLKLQLWIAVQTKPDDAPIEAGQLPQRHAALLVFTRYSETLRHTKTRIGYTFCPACDKTTKDYGGKKHTYHEYGTLISDVWRDIECQPSVDITGVVERIRDLFSIGPYTALHLVDLRGCRDLVQEGMNSTVQESVLALDWQEDALPQDSQLLNMDCLDALKSLPDNCVDFCFTDPPYNIQKKYDTWNDALELVHYFEWCDQWLAELSRVLKPGRTLAVINIPQWTIRHFQYLAPRMNFQAWIAWEGLSLPVRMIMPAHYAILCFTKGQARTLPGMNQPPDEEREYLTPLKNFFCVRSSCVAQRTRSDRGEISDLWADIHRLKHNSRRVDHPCQLPPSLMRRLYALFTAPGEMVLDCFDGAGTSSLVAHQMGRRFIGIELSPQYHQLAVKRHSQIQRGEDPFGKVDDIPTAKNSRVQRTVKQKYAVPKKQLQLDVKRIAAVLGHLPTRQEVQQHSVYPITYFDDYFLSWGEVCAAARTTGMSETRRTQTDFNESVTSQLDLFLPSSADQAEKLKQEVEV